MSADERGRPAGNQAASENIAGGSSSVTSVPRPTLDLTADEWSSLAASLNGVYVVRVEWSAGRVARTTYLTLRAAQRRAREHRKAGRAVTVVLASMHDVAVVPAGTR